MRKKKKQAAQRHKAMTHTYNTLTDAMVKQYAYIWSFERLREAEDNLNDHRLELTATIWHINNGMRHTEACQRFLAKGTPTVAEMTEELAKTTKFLRIIRMELVKRQTPDLVNTAYGIYGKFDGWKSNRRRWEKHMKLK